MHVEGSPVNRLPNHPGSVNRRCPRLPIDRCDGHFCGTVLPLRRTHGIEVRVDVGGGVVVSVADDLHGDQRVKATLVEAGKVITPLNMKKTLNPRISPSAESFFSDYDSVVDTLPEGFSRLEADNLRRRDFNRFPGVRISAGTCCAFLHLKGAKTQNLNVSTTYKFVCDDVQRRLLPPPPSASFPCCRIPFLMSSFFVIMYFLPFCFRVAPHYKRKPHQKQK